MEGSEAFQQFVDMQGKIGNAKKRSQAHNYSYTSLGELMDEFKSVWAEHGFGIVWCLEAWDMGEGRRKPIIVCKVLWKDGTCVAESGCPLIGIHEQDRGRLNPMQELGSAITYARRYTLLNCLCIACEDDDCEALSRRKAGEKVTMGNDSGY